MIKLKNILLGALLVVLNGQLKAQKLGGVYLPSIDENTPHFINACTNNDSLKQITLGQLDKEYAEYKRKIKKEKASIVELQEDLEVNNEAYEDAYILYYKRWRAWAENFVTDADMVALPAEEDPVQEGISNEVQKGAFNTVPQGTLSKRGASSTWSLLGPVTTHFTSTGALRCYQSNTYACAMAPSNHNVVYALPETGGIFKTSDKGLNWSLVLDDNNVGASSISTFSGDAYFSVAVAPSDENIVYAGRKNLIKKSTDGGSTWVSITFASGVVHSIIINPLNPETVLASCENGVFKSVDGGANWNLVASGKSFDLKYKPGDTAVIYCVVNVSNKSQIMKSTDGGNTFVDVTSGTWLTDFTKDNGSRLDISAASPDKIYVFINCVNPDSKPRLYRSTDAGATWQLQYTGVTGLANSTAIASGQGFYDWDIMVNPLNSDHVIAGTTTAFKSTNGGVTFTPLGGYYGPFGLHADIQSTIAEPDGLGGVDAWIATDGGMNYSSDFFTSTANHAVRINNLFGTDFWGFAQGWNEDMTGGGKYHNGDAAMHELYPTGQALQLGGGESGTGYYLMGKQRTMAFSDLGARQIPSTFTGSVKTVLFNNYPNEANQGFDASELETFPYCSKILYRGGQNGGATADLNTLWKSEDGGIIWSAVYQFPNEVRQFEISRSNPDVMYLATTAQVFKTTDGGVSWNALTLPTGQKLPRIQLSLSFTDENLLWICSPANTTGNRIFKTTDGGATWVNLTTTTIANVPVRNMFHQQGTDGGVYIVSKGGIVYYKNNSLSDWQLFNNGLPKGMYPLKTIPFYRDSKIRMAGNRAVWEVDFYEEGKPVAQPIVDKIKSSCPFDTFYFDDFSALNHSAATWQWTFSGTSNPIYVSSTNVRNPKVVFGALGTYNFKLLVSNGTDTSSKTITGKIVIDENLCAIDTVPGKVLTLKKYAEYAIQSNPFNVTTNNLTISVWIKPQGLQKNNGGIATTKTAAGSTNLNFLNNNRIGYYWNGDPNTSSWLGGPTVPLSEWSHLALVISPTSAVIYLNGVPYTHNYAHSPLTFSNPFLFGSDQGILNRTFKGQMDEVCIYNRSLSQSEIRNLMNLTKNNPAAGSMPSADPSLIGYYQFNEGMAPIYNKVGGQYLTLVGTASVSEVSTAPVGGGTVSTNTIGAAGTYNFANPGVELNFSTASTPNGEVVISRLNVPSDKLADTNILPNSPQSYYVIRNYGADTSFTGLNNIKFSNVQGTTPYFVSTPNELKLFKRKSNDFDNTWSSSVGQANVVTDNSGTGTVNFANPSVTSFSQFSIGFSPVPLQNNNLVFTATAQNNKNVQVNWDLNYINNILEFELQHSTDTQFVPLQKISASSALSYQYTHTTPSLGINKYRLKIMGTDSSTLYSPIRTATITPSASVVTVFPNPSENGWAKLQFSNAINNQKVQMRVYNSGGQLVKWSNIYDLNQIKSFYIGSPGIYFLHFILSEGGEFTKEILVE